MVVTDKMQTTTDGMANVAAGLGAANAKNQTTYLLHDDQASLELAYRGSGWFGRIVDIPATDTVREWRAWQADDDDVAALEKTEKKLFVKQKVRDALVKQRLLGGAVIIPSGLPGRPEQPLRIDAIRKDSIKNLILLDRYQVRTEGKVADLESPWFGLPEYYILPGQDGRTDDQKFHCSRVVRFSGPRYTNTQLSTDDCWGDSVWLRMADSIQASETGAAVLSQLMLEAKVDVFRIPDLVKNMATQKDEERLMRRFQIAQQLKSITNSLVMDKDDEYEQKTVAFSNLPETVQVLLNVMCGIAGIPMTRLLGSQSKGLSNGGDGDLKNYYDGISSSQELDLDPQLVHLDRMLIMSALGAMNEDIWHEWRPLYQMSEKEESEVEASYAKAVESYVNTGLFPPDALASAAQSRMVDSGSWPGLEAAMAASKQQAEEVKRGENGFEPTEQEKAAAAALAAGQSANENDPNAEGDTPPARRRGAANDATPKTLYVRRNLVNTAAIIDWANSQGISSTVTPEEMHVTIAYSRNAIDWMKAGESWDGDEKGQMRVKPGGVRIVEPLGDKGAVVLFFTSDNLTWRHVQIKNAGASWDYEDYQPHLTITYDGAALDLSNVEPYRGELIFGPEIFEELDADWSEKVEHT